MIAVGSGPDIWAEVVPAYLGAIGGIASAAVAVVAFVLGLRNKRSVASVKEALQPGEQPTVESAREPAPAREEIGSADGYADIGEPLAHAHLAGPHPLVGEPWSVIHELKAKDARHDLALANSSDRELTLLGIEIFNGTEWIPAFLQRASKVAPNEARYFDFKGSGGRESNINVIQVVWLEDDGGIRSQRVLL